MKRFILMLAVVMLAVLGVNAQTEKTLKGKLTNVQMNNNNYADVEGVTFILTDNGDGTGTLVHLLQQIAQHQRQSKQQNAAGDGAFGQTTLHCFRFPFL